MQNATHPHNPAPARAIWQKTLPVGHLIEPKQVSDEEAIGIAAGISRQLRVVLPSGWLDVAHDDYDEIAECLACEFGDLKSAAASSNKSVHAELNSLLASLYDWADEKGVLIS